MFCDINTLYRIIARSEWNIVHDGILREHYRLSLHPELVPPIIAQQLLISGEDHRHAIHPGFDPIAISRAIWRRLTSNRIEGASTIEQQIVRVITGNYQRTVRRKVKEIVLAFFVAQSFPKSILPSIYLSIAYYGWRMNGFSRACARLGMLTNSLTIIEAANLVARLKYPEAQVAPDTRKNQIARRTKHLLALYLRHRHTNTYRYLDDATIHNKSVIVPSFVSLSQGGGI
jgi:membrane peptidoglycan carboxypeptidase